MSKVLAILFGGDFKNVISLKFYHSLLVYILFTSKLAARLVYVL